MPTGYTAGIIDGKIKTFEQFATVCMRAFGPTIHMRDEPLTAKYVPRTPSDYDTKKITEAKRQLAYAKARTDKKIITTRKTDLQTSKKYHVEAIKKAGTSLLKLVGILQDVEGWQPPTADHTGIKEYMIDQIRTTIKHDCSTEYHKKELDKINKDLKSISAKNHPVSDAVTGKKGS